MNEPAYPAALAELMELLRTLPGVGKRSAERMALCLYQWDESRRLILAENLQSLSQRICHCRECGNLAEAGEKDICGICASPLRDHSVICVVEEATQIRTIESGGVFKGVYHVLGGRIAPLEGKGIESIRLELLDQRLADDTVKELILALSPDVEGQATAVYLAHRYQNKKLKLSRPAQGLPAGSDLSYADPATIAVALNGRISFGQKKEE